MLRVDHPFSFILFGASGHLSRVKIFPALYVLALKKRFPKDFTIIGYARTPMERSAFQEEFALSVRQAMSGAVNEEILSELLTHVHYQQGQYDSKEDFRRLSDTLSKLETSQETVRLAYLSVPPTVFEDVVRNLCAGGIHTKGRPFRCIVEKPVGSDRASFRSIHNMLSSCFTQDEVYILDHYLGKEAVRNLYYLRFANPIIESFLEKSLVTNVQITASESDGLEGRAGYFEAAGALRDMVQSHLLQIVAMLTMEIGNDTEIPINRLRALRSISCKNPSSHVFQAQYSAGKIRAANVPAYVDEPGVKAGSRTPTYVAARFESTEKKWCGVPFYVRSGKRLATKETKVVFSFRSGCLSNISERNYLEVILQGEAGLKLHLQTKLGGSEPKFRPLILEDPLVCMGDCLIEHSLLFLEAIQGNKRWFLSPEEVETCWSIIDPLQNVLDTPTTPLHFYSSGSIGPKEVDAFIAQDASKWF